MGPLWELIVVVMNCSIFASFNVLSFLLLLWSLLIIIIIILVSLVSWSRLCYQRRGDWHSDWNRTFTHFKFYGKCALLASLLSDNHIVFTFIDGIREGRSQPISRVALPFIKEVCMSVNVVSWEKKYQNYFLYVSALGLVAFPWKCNNENQ